MRVLAATTTFALFASQAVAVTVERFDTVPQEQQAEWLAAQVLLLRDWYEANGRPETIACLDILRKRSKATGNGDHTQGVGIYTLLHDEIDLARRRNPAAYHVEDIIFGVVEHECAKPENQQ